MLTIFGTHNLQTFKRNTLINKLLLIQFYFLNIHPKLHHWKWQEFHSHFFNRWNMWTLFSVCCLRD